MAEMKQKKPHAIMISVPYQGHINPFVNLALKLASKGFAITFVHLEFVHQKLSKTHHGNSTEAVDLFSEARESGLDIRYTTMGDGFPLEFDRDLHVQKYWKTIFRDFPGLVDEFVGKLIQSSEPHLVHFLIADTVNAWPAYVAQKHNLVNVSFWTEPALVFALAYHWDLLKQNGHSPCKDNSQEVEINYLPGIEPISMKDVMSFIVEEDIVSKNLFASFAGVKKADFILHNTVHELESDTITALNKYQPNYTIGPINFSKNLHSNSITKSLWAEMDCTDWLASKSHGSVLYVSFGSLVHTSKQMIEEIAYGLLLSGVTFIWVIRADILNSGETGVLPDGYEGKIKDIGLIISWCDQIKVLSNPAVGGFLTHNGWNSTVESMWCGVPMICCPIMWDQFTNRKLVVDDWKIGINICDGKSVDRNEVADKIKSLMCGDNSMSLRQEADKVKETLHRALEVEGSSERNFDQFVNDVTMKISCE